MNIVGTLIRTLVRDYGWVHLGIGLIGNALFIIGSVLFLPDWGSVHLPFAGLAEWKTVGVWIFIIGATLMFVGSLGELLVSIYTRRREKRRGG